MPDIDQISLDELYRLLAEIKTFSIPTSFPNALIQKAQEILLD